MYIYYIYYIYIRYAQSIYQVMSKLFQASILKGDEGNMWLTLHAFNVRVRRTLHIFTLHCLNNFSHLFIYLPLHLFLI